MSSVFVAGSCSPVVVPVARALGAGLASLGVVRSLAVGCAVGGDAGFLCGWGSVRGVSGASVFAAFGPGGVGACSLSAVRVVSRFAAAGGSVSWWAGGGPSVPLRARLACRSSACFGSVPAGSWAFVVLASPSSVGSLRSAVLAARRLSVFVVPLFPPSLLPSVWRGRALSWSPCPLPLGLGACLPPSLDTFTLNITGGHNV